MLNKLKFKLGGYVPVNEEEHRNIIKKIKLFLHIEEREHILYMLCNIKSFKRKDTSEDKKNSNLIYKIDIETSRPGILIGKGGKDIDKMKEFLELELNSNIEFKLRESKIITTY